MATASGYKSARPAESSAPASCSTLTPGSKNQRTTTMFVPPQPAERSGSGLPPARSASGSQLDTTTTPIPAEAAGFGLLTPAGTGLADAANGPHRDGRVRNPVPSKLKGKTDNRKGNFSVMLMDVAGRTEAVERDAAAKRTSESTELAAKLAFKNGYVSLRRSRFVHLPDEMATKPFDPSASSSASPPAPSSAPAAHRDGPLSPTDTKAEQARLLTLLRSLHPVLVVDQICKALAFFGGIPGAPPPADGSFPSSAESNGSGSLFVGWIAEIFPRLGHEGERMLSPVRALQDVPEIKRRRGRPKGSKATKARRDKGIKKGPKNKQDSRAEPSRPLLVEDVDEDGWVDIEDGVADLAGEADHGRSLPAANPESQTTAAGPAKKATSSPRRRPVAIPLPMGDGGLGIEVTPKRRGRPKGSKNRPKETTSNPEPTPVPPPAIPPSAASNPSFTAVNSAPLSQEKRKGGRPKGSKNKPKDQTASSAGPQQNSVQASLAHVNPPARITEIRPPIPAPVQTQQPSSSPSLVPAAPAGPPTQPNDTAAKGTKRKRKSAKTTDARPSTELVSNATGMQGSPAVNGATHQTPGASQGRAVDTPTSNNGPPTKRQRKSKESKSTPVVNHTEKMGAGSAASLTVEASLPSIQSPQQTSFEVQSPTMENYEAQLQAQLEQQQEDAPTPNRTDPRHLMANHLQKQQQQQKQQKHHSRQQASSAQSRSPNPQQQQQQQTVRNPQGHFSQYRPSNSPYTQQYASQPQPQQRQQQSPQLSTQQLQSQQQSQPVSSQPRYQHLTTSSAGTMSHAAHQSPPFGGTTTTNSYVPGDSSYRASPAMSASSSFGSRRTTNASPSDSAYRSTSNHSISQQQHHSSSFGTPTPQQRSSATSHPNVQAAPAQSMQGLQNMQPFQGYNETGIFDMSNLGTSASHNAMSLSTTSYNIGGANVPRHSNAGAAYSSAAMESFDASSLASGSDMRGPFYGGRRR